MFDFPSSSGWGFGQALVGSTTEGLDSLSAQERALLSTRAVPKRVAEFVAGRMAAKRAVTSLVGPTVDPVEILRDDAGAPLVVTPTPAPVRVSISHHAGHAIAVASHRAVGIDLVSFGPQSSAFVEQAFGPEELRRWARLWGRPEDDERVIALVFGLKEAVLKWLGLGFAVSLPSLVVTPAPESHPPAVTAIEVSRSDTRSHWTMEAHVLETGRLAAVWVWNRVLNPTNLRGPVPPSPSAPVRERRRR